ncbi:hypothetical protein HC251_04040 [Iamia sp. SCSIO 61187]|uniref:hypothetical protein n=1 Tax=Iamia sp. SCSIO 61187 TaxID=2722752 RepID=UPI001C634FA7|nr:hypothetical protein [Iamia sp. SCSIO 61187]QYG91690.1 hypothetical protein HC251_04040 [Iamia sp. SCSIO 61187]
MQGWGWLTKDDPRQPSGRELILHRLADENGAWPFMAVYAVFLVAGAPIRRHPRFCSRQATRLAESGVRTAMAASTAVLFAPGDIGVRQRCQNGAGGHDTDRRAEHRHAALRGDDVWGPPV